MDTGQLYSRTKSLQTHTGLQRDGVSNSRSELDNLDMEVQLSPSVSYDAQSLDYDMSGDKYLFTFNLDTKPDAPHSYKNPCSYYDESNLYQTFGDLGFTVHDPFTDFTHHQVFKELKAVCTRYHRNTSCVAFVFLGHSDTEGEMNANDKPFLLKDVVDLVLREPALAGKPKLFFNRACRQHNHDPGHRVFRNRRVATHTVPTHSDMLAATSYEDQAKGRPGQGSRFVETLCDVLTTHHKDQDLLDMMTLVNSRVDTKVSTTFTKFLKV